MFKQISTFKLVRIVQTVMFGVSMDVCMFNKSLDLFYFPNKVKRRRMEWCL